MVLGWWNEHQIFLSLYQDCMIGRKRIGKKVHTALKIRYSQVGVLNIQIFFSRKILQQNGTEKVKTQKWKKLTNANRE